jgi:hypothetical protein
LNLKGGWRVTPVSDDDAHEQINHVATEDELKEDCIICLEHKINVKFIRCGHCICYGCYQIARNNNSICSLCRGQIENIFILNTGNNMWEKQENMMNMTNKIADNIINENIIIPNQIIQNQRRDDNITNMLNIIQN